MLQRIRTHVQGWIATIILGIISLTFVFWGIGNYLNPTDKKHQALATVNGQKITQQAVEEVYQHLKQKRMASNSAPLSEQEQSELRNLALTDLISKTVLQQQAEKEGFVVTPEQLKSYITQLPVFQQQGQFSLPLLQRLLQANGYTPEEFEAEIRSVLLSGQVSGGLTMSAFALPDELSLVYQLLDQTRDFSYFLISANSFLSGAQINSADIEKYYQAHQEDFSTPTRLKIQYLILSPQQLKKTATLDPKEVLQYYQDNPQNFTTPTEWTVQELTLPVSSEADDKTKEHARKIVNEWVNQLKAGKAFESVGTITVRDVTANALSSEELDLLTAMKPQEISKPYQNAEGWHMVKLLTVRKGKVRPFDDVKAEIKENLIDQKISATFSQQSEQLSNLAYTQPDSLEPAAKALDLPLQQSNWLTASGEKSGLFANPLILRAAFSEAVLNEGNNSEPIELENGDMVVLRVQSKDLSQVQPLNQVQSNIESLLKAEQARKKAEEQAQQLLVKLQQNVPENTIASDYHLQWLSKTAVSLQNKEVAPAVLKAAFEMAPTSNLLKQPVIAVISVNPDTWAVVRLDNISLGSSSEALTASKRAILDERVKSYQADLEYQLYQKEALAKASIKEK